MTSPQFIVIAETEETGEVCIGPFRSYERALGLLETLEARGIEAGVKELSPWSPALRRQLEAAREAEGADER
jgi:hypothetical protein